jgi:hypothetical protein
LEEDVGLGVVGLVGVWLECGWSVVDGLVPEERGWLSRWRQCLGVLSVSESERMEVKEERSDGEWE